MCVEVGRSGRAFGIRVFRAQDAGVAGEILREAPEAVSWSERALLESLGSPGNCALISERDGRATGFIIGRHVSDEGEILNLAVRENSRRHGEGRALVELLIVTFRDHGVSRVFLEVRQSNLGGIAFYERMGFRRSGVRQSYYRDPVEDALVMEAGTKVFTV